MPTSPPAFYSSRNRCLMLRAGDVFDSLALTLPTLAIRGSYPTSYLYTSLSGLLDSTFVGFLQLPPDFVSVTGWDVTYANSATSTSGVGFELYYSTMSEGDALTKANDVTMTGTSTPPAVADQLVNYQIGTSNTGLVAGGLLRLNFGRKGSTDASLIAMNWVGIRLRYLAEI